MRLLWVFLTEAKREGNRKLIFRSESWGTVVTTVVKGILVVTVTYSKLLSCVQLLFILCSRTWSVMVSWDNISALVFTCHLVGFIWWPCQIGCCLLVVFKYGRGLHLFNGLLDILDKPTCSPSSSCLIMFTLKELPLTCPYDYCLVFISILENQLWGPGSWLSW